MKEARQMQTQQYKNDSLQKQRKKQEEKEHKELQKQIQASVLVKSIFIL